MVRSVSAFFAASATARSTGALKDVVFCCDLVDDAGSDGVGAAVTPCGGHRVVRGSVWQASLEQGGHAGRERHAEVGFGHAPVAAVGAHHDLVVCGGEHRSRGERVALDGGDGLHAGTEERGEQPVVLVDQRLELILVCPQPLQVQPVRPEDSRSPW